MIDRKEWKSAAEELPEFGEGVICRNSNFQALGYLDHQRQWRFHDGSAFNGVQFWQSLGATFNDRPASRALEVSRFCAGNVHVVSFAGQ